MQINRERIRKILVIKFGGIGDIMLSTPVLPNLREYFPEANIHYFTMRKCRDILVDNYYINRVLTYDRNEDTGSFLLRHIRRQKYDLVIDLYCNPRTALIAFLSGAKYRFGFNFRGRKYAYNIIARGRGGEVHNVEFNLDALRKLKIPIKSKHLNISVNIVHEEFADEFINSNNLDNKFLLGIALTGGWESKKYKVNDYIELIKRLSKIYDVKFILIWGTKDELEGCKKIKDNCKDTCGDDIYIIPESPIRYLAAIISKCNAIICSDSGPMHIAVTQKVPVLAIYGPTNPKLQGPYGEKNITVVNENLDCLCCDYTRCPIGNICMTELSKEIILKKFTELININNLKIPLK